MSHSDIEVISEDKDYKIVYYRNSHQKNSYNKVLVITFGDVVSGKYDRGFGTDFFISQGIDHIYVAQRKRTFYQGLSKEDFSKIVAEYIFEKNVVCYGNSLGAYAALYYGECINAKILAFSPRNPLHPINPMLNSYGIRASSKFRHDFLLSPSIARNNKPIVIYDQKNTVDSFYVQSFVLDSFPKATLINFLGGGHHTLELMSQQKILKNFVLNVIFNFDHIYSSSVVYDYNALLDYHIRKALIRINRGKFEIASDNVEALSSIPLSHTLKWCKIDTKIRRRKKINIIKK